jgi:bifunctional UDP-N-acetylglucosamine pyrophosphorylase/glucosamine-1-phosphate N-acetyltransferase
MNTDTQIVILAAGKGNRMGSDIPKALTPLGGKTMLDYVIETSLNFNSEKPIVVIGYKGDLLKEKLGDSCLYALQEEQNGTGHAVMMTRELLLENEADTVIVLFADMPYLSVDTLNKLTETKHEKNAKIVIATSVIEDDDLFENQFFNFGRIIRDENGTISKIVEKRDASEKEVLVREVNPAFFCLDKKWMLEKLDNLKNDNSQNEYYLTDLVQMAFDEGLTIESVQINEREALGANTPEQLKVLEKYLEK